MTIVNAIVEARMGSVRLPGKTLMPIVGKPVLKLVIERLKIAKNIARIIVAAPVNSEDDAIEDLCAKSNIDCFRGSPDDVLNRVYSAAKKYKTEAVVEVTADCPLLDPWLIDECIDIFLKSGCDYLSNFIEQSYPPGIDVQIFKSSVLKEVESIARDAKFREHVTLYILKHPGKYRLHNVTAPEELFFPDWHLELDEYEDYELIKKIYEHLYYKNPEFTTRDIIGLLKKNTCWLDLNKKIERAWEKARKA